MNTLTAIDTLNCSWYELSGFAGIIDQLAENEVLLTQEQLDFLGTVAARISSDIHEATDIIYREYQKRRDEYDD